MQTDEDTGDAALASAAASLMARLQSEGCDPVNPSLQWREATRRIDSPFTGIAADCLQLQRISILLMKRFGRDIAWRGDDGRRLLRVAAAFVYFEITPKDRWDWSGVDALHAALDTWHRENVVPRTAAMIAALETHGALWLRENAAQFEPAATFGTLCHDLVASDFDRDCKLLGLGLAMHRAGKTSPGNARSVTDEQLVAHFEFLTRDGRSITKIDPHGEFALAPGAVKSAMDTLVGAPSAHAPSELNVEEPEAITDAQADFLDVVEAIDAARAVREAIEERLRDPELSKSALLVLRNFEALAGGETTVAQLAREAGLHHSSVYEAYEVETGAIRVLLRVA